MSNLEIGVKVDRKDLSPGIILKSLTNNDEHIVVAVTEDRIWVQVDGPCIYETKRDKVTRDIVDVLVPGVSGQLREFGFGSFDRRGFMYQGECDQAVLKMNIVNYLKQVCNVTSQDVENFVAENTDEPSESQTVEEVVDEIVNEETVNEGIVDAEATATDALVEAVEDPQTLEELDLAEEEAEEN